MAAASQERSPLSAIWRAIPMAAPRAARHPAPLLSSLFAAILAICAVWVLAACARPALADAAAIAHLLRAQSAASSPGLHRRADSQALAEKATETDSRGRSTLSPDVSGEYLLGKSGESIEIDLRPDQLGGYISRFGDQASDQGEPLTFFFATAALDGPHISFRTHSVHGEWFSFSGTIVRGDAASRAEAGYYRLKGTLVLHDALRRTAQARDVSLPLAREYQAPPA